MRRFATKFRVGSLKRIREACRKAGARLLEEDQLLESYFRTPSGRLKLRESRTHGCELIPYVAREGTDSGQLCFSQLPIADAEQAGRAKLLLSRILGVDVVVEKKRQSYLIGGLRLHLDEVKGLGCYLDCDAIWNPATQEFCAITQERVAWLLRGLGVEGAREEPRSYYSLVRSLAQSELSVVRGYYCSEEPSRA